MRKKNRVYCTNCGHINKITDKVCIECKKKIYEKDHLIKEFIIHNTKDELKNKVEENLFVIIKNFIISHLYATVVTATIIFTASSVVYVNINDNNDNVVDSKPKDIIEILKSPIKYGKKYYLEEDILENKEKRTKCLEEKIKDSCEPTYFIFYPNGKFDYFDGIFYSSDEPPFSENYYELKNENNNLYMYQCVGNKSTGYECGDIDFIIEGDKISGTYEYYDGVKIKNYIIIPNDDYDKYYEEHK